MRQRASSLVRLVELVEVAHAAAHQQEDRVIEALRLVSFELVQPGQGRRANRHARRLVDREIMFYPSVMNPIPIPQAAKDHYEPQGAQERVYGAPPGHEDDTGAAYALMIEGLEGQAYGKQVSLPLELTDEDRAAIAEGKPIWLTLAGYTVIPFCVSVGDVPPVI